MKIKIISWGSLGDVAPYIALSLGLQNAGHIVELATFSDYKEIVESYGINCIPIDGNLEKIKYPRSMHHTIRTIVLQRRLLKLFQDTVLPEIARICQDAEAIIFGEGAHPILEVIEKLGIPSYAAFAQPHHPTHAFPVPYMPCRFNLGKLYNWLSYFLFDQLSWQFFRQPLNIWRQKNLHLSTLSPWAGIVRRMQQKQIPCLYSYSPSVLPKPADWADWLHVTGYWFLDRQSHWQPPANLVDFLADGTPPIYISNNMNRDILNQETVLEVLALTKQRIIVQSLNDDVALPDEVFNIKQSIPHEWLFPQVSAIVHHGGCGTTMNSLRAGIPTIIIPSITDQFFWGNRIAKLGLGPTPILRREFSAKKLAVAIQVAITDQKMQQRAADMGKKIQAENGVKLAVEAFHYHLPSQQNKQSVYVA